MLAGIGGATSTRASKPGASQTFNEELSTFPNFLEFKHGVLELASTLAGFLRFPGRSRDPLSVSCEVLHSHLVGIAAVLQ